MPDAKIQLASLHTRRSPRSTMVEMTYIAAVATTCTLAFFGLLMVTSCLLHPEITGAKASTYKQVGSSVFDHRWSWSNTALLSWRVFCFLWFFCGAFVAKWSYDIDQGEDPKYWYYTVWNLILLGVYFLVASLCSWQYYMDPMDPSVRNSNASDDNDDDAAINSSSLSTSTSRKLPPWWSEALQMRLVTLSNVLYDVAGYNSIFVTLVTFLVLDSSGRFWNVVNHLTNFLFIFVDLLLNDIRPQAYNYFYGLWWIYTYAVFTWIIVGAGVRDWPYTFMSVSKASSIIVYVSLLLLNILLYLLWMFMAGLCKGGVLRHFSVQQDFFPATTHICCCSVQAAPNSDSDAAASTDAATDADAAADEEEEGVSVALTEKPSPDSPEPESEL